MSWHIATYEGSNASKEEDSQPGFGYRVRAPVERNSRISSIVTMVLTCLIGASPRLNPDRADLDRMLLEYCNQAKAQR
jgi:hypothetical protein